MATFGSLATAAGRHIHRADVLQDHASDLQQKQSALNAGTAPKSVTQDGLDRANRNLSHAQFRHRMEVASTASDAASSATASTGTSPGTPGFSPDKAIGSGLYS